jgi:hypothetical protein
MIPELISCFDQSLSFMLKSVEDLSDEEMFLQPPGVPNHAAWTLGHVICSCQEMAAEMGVERWLAPDWESRFGYGSTPLPASCMSKAELLAAALDASDRLRTALLELDERKLSEPLPDEAARNILPTISHALVQIVAAHSAFHAGQLAAWRRAIGKKPAAVFV